MSWDIDFWAKSIKTLVFPSPIGYMLCPYDCSILNQGKSIPHIQLKLCVNFRIRLELQPVHLQLEFGSRLFIDPLGTRVRQEPKASVLSAYKICDLAYKILKV